MLDDDDQDDHGRYDESENVSADTSSSSCGAFDGETAHRQHDKPWSSKNKTPSRRGLFLQLNLSGIGVSVVDSVPQELVYLTVQDLTLVAVGQPMGSRSLELRVGSVQIDNQRLGARFPTLLAPTSSAFSAHSSSSASEGSSSRQTAAESANSSTRGTTVADDKVWRTNCISLGLVSY
jgi:hypothetical protein